MARQKNRIWSDEEKRSICFQTLAPGVSISQVARRYAMNTNLIHKWLKDPRYAPEAQPAEEPETLDGDFYPVEISAPEAQDVGPERPNCEPPPMFARRVDITLSDGRRVLVEGPTTLASVITLVEGLIP